MRMKIRMLMLLLGAALMGACGTTGEQNDKTEPQTKEARQEEISRMEDELRGKTDLDAHVNKARADALIKRYRDYVVLNPDDSISAEYLFKAADLSIGTGSYEASINYLDRIITDYPGYHKIVEIMLFKGFVYENYLNSHAEATKAYRALIERYPNHRLAKDAEAAIQNLTLSEEELIEKLKQTNQEQAGT